MARSDLSALLALACAAAGAQAHPLAPALFGAGFVVDGFARDAAGRLLPARGQRRSAEPDDITAQALHKLRSGASFHDDWLIGRVRGPTLDLMVQNRMIGWSAVEPFDRVRTSIEVSAHDQDWRNRRAAMAELGGYPSERSEDALIAGLRDPTLAVRDQAIIELGKVGTNRCVPALIDCLKRSPGPTRDLLDDSLRRLTGEDYGRHMDRWKRWYDASRGRLR